jgi:hypothetical protein
MKTELKIVIGADHAGFDHKEALVEMMSISNELKTSELILQRLLITRTCTPVPDWT